MIAITSAAQSPGGRAQQQDYFRHGTTSRSYYAVVCDGLGGRPDARVSATAAATTAEDYVKRAHLGPNRRKLVRYLMGLPSNVQLELQRLAATGQIAEDAATTMTVCLVMDDQAWLMTIGDSRCTVFRGGEVYETTTPHNRLSESRRDGPADAAAPASAALASSLTRAIGPRQIGAFTARERIPLLIVPLLEGDVIVVTSDGVHEPLGLSDVSRTVAGADMGNAAQRLVDLAVARSGADADNATAVVLEIVELDRGAHGPA